MYSFDTNKIQHFQLPDDMEMINGLVLLRTRGVLTSDVCSGSMYIRISVG